MPSDTEDIELRSTGAQLSAMFGQGPISTVPRLADIATGVEGGGDLEFVVVANDGHPQHMIWLVSARNIFAQQLPKMPREYITRLVLDRRHRTLIALKQRKVVGGICYRPYFRQRFAEIAFCAITSSEQVRGYGTRLMNHLKQAVKADGIINFLTYADNYAIGYFSKQGFTKDVSMSRRRWFGYIKDYEGGTLMECTIHPAIDYLRQQQVFERQKQILLQHIASVQQKQCTVPQLIEHPTVPEKPKTSKRASDATPSATPTARESTRPRKMKEQVQQAFRSLITQTQRLPESWPFLEPVDISQVPDYYDVIKEPIDLSFIDKKAKRGGYNNLSELRDDMKLMTDNCRKYNDPGTDYVTCANAVDTFVEKQCNSLASKHGDWIFSGIMPPTPNE